MTLGLLQIHSVLLWIASCNRVTPFKERVKEEEEGEEEEEKKVGEDQFQAWTPWHNVQKQAECNFKRSVAVVWVVL